jgi:hypothetical protein
MLRFTKTFAACAMISLFLAVGNGQSEQIATTDDGKKVILYDNGIWKYAENEISSSRPYTGFYVDKDDSRTHIELHPDGTFYNQKADGSGLTGKYEVKGNQITLITPLGFASKGTLRNDGSFIIHTTVFIKKR